MPVPFRAVDDVDELPPAGYLRLLDDGPGHAILAGLFVVTARGEPLEFTYNRAEPPDGLLWNTSDAPEAAERALVETLLRACVKTPGVLLYVAAEVSPRLFTAELQLDVPACSIASLDASRDEPVDSTDRLQWVAGPPGALSPWKRVVEALARRGLLIEPFERAARALAAAGSKT